MQSAVILIHRSHLQLKTSKLQQTEMACIMHGIEDKTDCKSLQLWELQDKPSQVINQLSPSMPHENIMIAKTITDLAFALIKAIPIIITIACRSSNKKTIFILRGQNSLYWLNISEASQIRKQETSFVEKGVAW